MEISSTSIPASVGKLIRRMQDAPDPANEKDIAAARGWMLRRGREAICLQQRKNIQ